MCLHTPQPSPAVQALADDVTNWMRQLRHPAGGYRYARQAFHPYCGEATAAAVGVHRELGTLEHLPYAERRQLVDQLKSYQRDDGSFHDSALSEEDRLDPQHPWSKVDEHLAGVCEQALAMLGDQPRLENTTEPIYDLAAVDIETFIPSLDHRASPWGRCHNIAFSLLWYRLRHRLEHDTDSRLDRTYELIKQEMLNSADGMPGATDHPIGNRLAGYYMLTFAYLPFNRPMPNPRAAIDLIIAATYTAGRIEGMCHIFDAIYVLNVVGKQLEWQYRFEEAHACASRVADVLLREHRKPDGGFSFEEDRSLEHQNFIRATPATGQSDLQGTLMALACLNIIDHFRSRKWHPDYLNPWIRFVGRQTDQAT